MKPSPSRPENSATGYMSQAFGHAFRRLGRIVTLPGSGLQLIERQIRPGLTDLVGLYPYAMCHDFAALAGPADQTALKATGAVALSFVADPFATGTVRAELADWTVCRRFKTHFMIDLASDWRAARTKNTRYYVRQGYKAQAVTIVTKNADTFAADFWALYAATMRRFGATGVQKMSPDMIAEQLAVPGIFLALAYACDDGALIGAMMSYAHDSHVNMHLVGFDQTRYVVARTSYVLIDAAAAHAESLGCRWLNIGGPAGMDDDPADGLYNFKRRWTPHRRETMLCGQVLDPAAYAALCTETGTENTAYFPAYRAPGSPYEWHPEL